MAHFARNDNDGDLFGILLRSLCDNRIRGPSVAEAAPI
jgi:hypothetical protein